MKILRVSFVNKKGNDISGRLTLPDDQPPLHFALIAHCFTCNKNFNSVRNISKAITAAGFGVLSLDFTGLGNSEGNFSDTTFSTNVEDLLSAADFLKTQYLSPVLVVGHSFGGPAAIYAAANITSVRAVATIAAPSDVAHVKHLLHKEIALIKEEGEARVKLGDKEVIIGEQFLTDIEEHDLQQVVKELKKPILIMHAPQDTTVTIDHAEKLYNEAKHPKSFISLDKADHLLNNKKDALYAGEVIAAWVKRYLPGSYVPAAK